MTVAEFLAARQRVFACDCPQLPPERDPQYAAYLHAGIVKAVQRRLAIDRATVAHRPR